MTARARMVLQDCKHAISRYSDELQGEALRVSWVSIIVLLRTVGHVLAKVDRRASEPIARAIDAWWYQLKATRPEPTIFWEFIDKDRNQMLKLYEANIDRRLTGNGPMVDGKPTKVSISLTSMRGGRVSVRGGDLTSVIKEGPFAGRHELEIAREAYEWWKGELDAIDGLASSS